MTRRSLLAALVALSLSLAATAASAQHLRIGLREDPDILDPTLGRTYVGRLVFAALCDKLFDLDEQLGIVPQLATGHAWEDPQTLRITLRPGVVFHDGETLDAEAVKVSLLRHQGFQGSFRRAEMSGVTAVDVVDPLTVRVRLNAPSAAFLATLTDRAGMIMSPRALESGGRDFGRAPVCAGPFRFVERVAQDRIVLERFPAYWDSARISVQRVTFRPIPDNNVRLANLQSGALDFAERMEADDMTRMQRDRSLRVLTVAGLGFQSIQFNLGNGARAQTPLGQDRRVREAFDLAIDRAAINQVVYEGLHAVGIQPFPPASPFHVAALTPPARDVGRARALLREAGVTGPLPVELTIPNNPDLRQVGEVIQAMVREAGFELTLRATEFASSLQAATRGEFESYLIAWSGRSDPDGNVYSFFHSQSPGNESRYANPEVDRLLDAARAEFDEEKRRDLYARLVRILAQQDRPRIMLWNPRIIMAHSTKVTGYRPNPDGLIRLQGLTLAPR